MGLAAILTSIIVGGVFGVASMMLLLWLLPDNEGLCLVIFLMIVTLVFIVITII